MVTSSQNSTPRPAGSSFLPHRTSPTPPPDPPQPQGHLQGRESSALSRCDTRPVCHPWQPPRSDPPSHLRQDRTSSPPVPTGLSAGGKKAAVPSRRNHPPH